MTFSIYDAQQELERFLCSNLLSAIQNSLGSCQYQTLYMRDEEGNAVDVLQNGSLSCAYYVSCILKTLNLVEHTQVNVEVTVCALLKSGWHETKKPLPGTVLVWEGATTTNGNHKHIGFSIGGGSAVSHCDTSCTPEKHTLIYRNRPLECVLDHVRLLETR